MTRSIHDNQVLGYSVSAESRTIVVHTEFRDGGEPPFERTDVRFDGVLGYYFQDNLSGILFGIEQVEFAQVVKDHADLFQIGAPYWWPFQTCDGDPVDFVRSAGAIAFQIHSSIGFNGFVVCKSMMFEAAQPAAAAGGAKPPPLSG